MLEVEGICSILHSIVSDCKERGEDPTEMLSSEALLEQIAQVEKVRGNKKEINRLQNVRNETDNNIHLNLDKT